MTGLRVGVFGATGAVGREMWKQLESAPFEVAELRAFTTARSAGTELTFRGHVVRCLEISAGTISGLDLVLASAGATASREWSPQFVRGGAIVVDNSSAFRGDPNCPLVIPEVNAHHLHDAARIIAVPNCSTIQMVAALAPLHRAWGLRTIRVATYQSASGAGAAAMEELLDGTRKVLAGETPSAVKFPEPLAFNVVPHIGTFDAEGESQEETKMRQETRRILDAPDLQVSATCVRVPVLRGHSEAIWASFAETPDPQQACTLMSAAGIAVTTGGYTVPRAAAGHHEVFAGRVRRDPADANGLCLWVVSDNLLKGAATNAFQIAMHLLRTGAIPAKASA